MPKLSVVKSRQSRVSGQPSQVAGALIPDNTQHSWRDDVGEGFKSFCFERSLIMALVGRRDGRNFGWRRIPVPRTQLQAQTGRRAGRALEADGGMLSAATQPAATGEGTLYSLVQPACP